MEAKAADLIESWRNFLVVGSTFHVRSCSLLDFSVVHSRLCLLDKSCRQLMNSIVISIFVEAK